MSPATSSRQTCGGGPLPPRDARPYLRHRPDDRQDQPHPRIEVVEDNGDQLLTMSPGRASPKRRPGHQPQPQTPLVHALEPEADTRRTGFRRGITKSVIRITASRQEDGYPGEQWRHPSRRRGRRGSLALKRRTTLLGLPGFDMSSGRSGRTQPQTILPLTLRNSMLYWAGRHRVCSAALR